MKTFTNQIRFSVRLLLGCIAFSACSLERYPLTDLSENTFWNPNSSNAQLALTTLYRGNIKGGVEFAPSDWWSYQGLILLEHLSDNAFDRRGENNAFFKISSGNLTADNAFIKHFWSFSYERIGYCNRFLAGMRQKEDTQQNRRMMAEARFLRATQYFYLASYFKNVPLVERVLTGSEANNVTKTDQATILDWCVAEFTAAAADLPRFSEITASETGRACRQAALAFLGRTRMLQKNWKAGAEAYQQIMALGDNELHTNYRELFGSAKGTANKENIFYVQYLANYLGLGLPQHALSAKDGGWSLINPAAGLFEAYEFKDGTAFSYDDARYDPENLGAQRDPRLDYTLYYNGATFMGSTYRISPDYSDAKKERLDYSSEASRTGFMMRKYFDESKPIANIQDADGLLPVIRYAEVLLGYLECAIEDGQTITEEMLNQTINPVRMRAGVDMPAITTTDATQLREIVRNERRVELAMEGIRYWDLLRWGIAHEALSQKIWGAPYPNAEKYAASTKEIDPTGHCRWYVGRRAFRNPQDYSWPIPQSEQNINPNLRD